MFIFSVLFLTCLFYVNCQGNHFGFATEDGDRIIIGEFVSSICTKNYTKEIWQLTCALNSTRFSYEHQNIYVCPSILRKMRKSSKRSIKRMYEVEPMSIVSLLQKRLVYENPDSSSFIFFEKPLLITTDREINESFTVYPSEIIIIDLIEEMREPSPSEVNLSDDYGNTMINDSEPRFSEGEQLCDYKLERKNSSSCSIS